MGTTNSQTDETEHMVLFLTVDTPCSHQEAMTCSDADSWVEAIMEEYQNLKWKGVFIEVEVPQDKHVHEGWLVFAEKVRSGGEVIKKKVRLVAKGYMEIWGEDYWNTYSPTLGHNSLLSILTYATAHNLKIHQMDTVAAYLNSDLTEEIYIHPPDGIPSNPSTVWLLKKALYSLKQVGLEWYHMLWSHIKSIGYVQSGYDWCLYVQGSKHLMVVHTDDLLVVGTKERITHKKKEVAKIFEMHNLGEVHWFLAMEITHDQIVWMITIDQWQYMSRRSLSISDLRMCGLL